MVAEGILKERENTSLQIDVRRSKTPLLKLLIMLRDETRICCSREIVSYNNSVT